MLGLNPLWAWIAVMAAVGLVTLRERLGLDRPERIIGRLLDHRATPAVFGAVTGLIIAFVWNGTTRYPVIHDEAAYVLQAELFAAGRWAGPPPALPEFFEQLYVLVTPVLASKYPPGHSLLLSVGALVGNPGIMVLLLNAVTGAMIVAVARRVAGAAAALLTWVIWITSYPAIYFRATYLSEVTSSVGVLAAWWCLLRWRENHQRQWILGVAAASALVAITRPLTAVAVAIPIAVVVLGDVASRRLWRDLVAACVAGTLLVAVLPIWSMRTTGSPTLTPLTLYTRTYVPFDKPGFGVDTSVHPMRTVPRDLAATNTSFREEHRAHTIASLPSTAGRRFRRVAYDMWYEWRLGLAPIAVIGLVAAGAAAWFGIASLLSHLAMYLLYAHPASWTVYYLETTPVLALLTALGLVHVFRWAGNRRPVTGNGMVAMPALILALIAAIPATLSLGLMREQIRRDQEYFSRFHALLQQLPRRPSIVFVRYAARHNDNLSLVRNPADIESARTWVVHDRGGDNDRLLAASPARRGYLFDEATWTLTPMLRTGISRDPE